MNPALYIFVNRGLGMSPGKIAAQVVQATAGILDSQHDLYEAWWNGPGKHHAVYVMLAEDTEHLYSIDNYLFDRGFRTYLMIDEGMTEVRPITPTVLAVEIVDRDDENVAATFSSFKLYKEKKPEPPKAKHDLRFWRWRP